MVSTLARVVHKLGLEAATDVNVLPSRRRRPEVDRDRRIDFLWSLNGERAEGGVEEAQHATDTAPSVRRRTPPTQPLSLGL